MLVFPIPDFFHQLYTGFWSRFYKQPLYQLPFQQSPPLTTTSRQRLLYFVPADSLNILILFQLYHCSKHKLSTILLANVAKLARFATATLRIQNIIHISCVFYLCIIFYYWISIMGYSKHELSTIDMLYLPKKIVILLSYLPIGQLPLPQGWPLWRGSTVYPFPVCLLEVRDRSLFITGGGEGGGGFGAKQSTI